MEVIAVMAKRAKSFDQQMAEAQRQLGLNLKWAVHHDEELRRFAGRWVAVDNGEVIAVASDPVALDKRFVRRRGVLIHYVWPPGQGRILRIAMAGA